MSRTRWRWSGGFALAVAVAFGFVLLPASLGGRASYVTTHGSSMAPRVHQGDLMVVKPAATPLIAARYRREVVDAGSFSEWIVAMQEGMRSGSGSDVPCAGCVACCTSGQTIVVDADEHHALSHLPPHALVPIGDGEHVLARDGAGRCVLLVDGACSAYEHRPIRCRTYDCRIFPAAGLLPEDDKPAIAERAAAWRFRYDTREDSRRQEATRMAVVVLRSSQLGGRLPSATQLAAAAAHAHEEFLPEA